MSKFREALEKNYAEQEEKAVEQEDAPETPVVESEEDPEQGVQGAELLVEQQPEPLQPHARWDEDTRTRFSKADREWQQWLLDREHEMESSYTRKTQDLAQKERDATPIIEAVKPFEEMLFGYRVDAPTAIRRILTRQQELDNPETHFDALKRLVHSYGHSFEELARYEQQTSPQRGVDPVVQQLQSKLQELEAWKQEQLSAAQSSNEQGLIERVTAWSQEKGADGKPLRPYFDDVARAMMGLIPILAQEPANANRSEAELLQLAYDESIKPYNKLLEQEKAKRVEKARAAKLAGSSINGAGTSAGQGSDKMTFRERLEAKYDQMTA